MNYWLIYFGIVLFVLVSKFVQALVTIDKLKTFIANNKSVIESYCTGIVDNSYLYLFSLHFSTFSYGEDYVRYMRYGITNYCKNEKLFAIFIFAIMWPISIPSVLLSPLLLYCYKRLNNFLKNI